HRIPATGFEDIEKTLHIAVDIRLRVIDAVPHTGLRGEVNNNIWSNLFKQGSEVGPVYQVEVVKGGSAVAVNTFPFYQAFLPNTELLKPGILQPHIVVGI